MDNVGGRSSWNSQQYLNTNLRQPNSSNQPNSIPSNGDFRPSSSSSSSSSQLSIDAPEFIPQKFKSQLPTQLIQPVPGIIHPGIIDPAIIMQQAHGITSHFQPHVNHSVLPGHHNNMHSHQHPHPSQQPPPPQQIHPSIHEQNTMAVIGGAKPDHHRFSVQNRLMNIQHGTNNAVNNLIETTRNLNLEYNGGDMYSGQQSVSHQNNDHAQPTVSEKENRVLNYLSETMNKLTDNPGMFEDIQRHLSNMFYEFASNNFVMSNAVEMIFEMSVDEQNFRYIGARLCRLLDIMDANSGLFRSLLCLKIDDHQTKLGQFIINEQRKVRGTTLFMAELYMQMQSAKDGTRISKIADSIVQAMRLLLEKIGPENVKCVCQSLKLCGYELEIDCPMDITSILEQLEKSQDKLDVSTGRLLQSVLELKRKHWGRSAPIVMAPILETMRQDYNDVPVFYGPDGQVLTDEENSFLLSNIPPSYALGYEEMEENDPDGEELVDVEPEMDLEIQMAFKDFVKNSKK